MGKGPEAKAAMVGGPKRTRTAGDGCPRYLGYRSLGKKRVRDLPRRTLLGDAPPRSVPRSRPPRLRPVVVKGRSSAAKRGRDSDTDDSNRDSR